MQRVTTRLQSSKPSGYYMCAVHRILTASSSLTITGYIVDFEHLLDLHIHIVIKNSS